MTDMTRRTVRNVVIGAAVVAVAAIYFLVDPASSRLMPQCIFHRLTGLQCPGCGSQRLLHALLHGDFAAAWQANALLLLLLPWLILLACTEFFPHRLPRTHRLLHSPLAIAAAAILIIGWGIFRNL